MKALFIEANSEKCLALSSHLDNGRWPGDYRITTSSASPDELKTFDLAVLDAAIASPTATQWIDQLNENRVPILVKALPDDEVVALDLLKQGAHDYVTELSGHSFGVLAHKAQQLVNFYQSQRANEFQLLVEHLPTGIVVHGPETHVLTCNSKAAELLGLTQDQMQGKSALDPAWHFLREDGSPLTLEEYPVNQVIANQKPIDHFVAGVYRPSVGNHVWLLINAYPFFGHDQTLEKVVVTFVDISAQKQAQLNLKLSQQRYESLAQAAPVGIFQTDPEGNCTYVNDRWSAIAGLPFDRAQGQGWIAGLHPDDRAAVAAEWYEAAQHKRPFSLEYRFQIATGAITWVYGQAVAERDDQGIITGYVGTVTDITDRRLAEEKLRESEARYRLLFQEANDIVLIHPLGTAAQPGQYFTDVNEITCRLLGYSRDELRQMTPLDLIPDEEMAEVAPEMEVLTETGQLLFEKTLVAKDGTHIPVELHAHVFDWQGEPTVLSIARNIQERKTAQAELEEREWLFRSTFEQAAVGIAHVSPTGHFTRLNQRFCTILNYPHAELITLALQDITHLDDLQVDEDQVNRLLAGEDSTYSVEKRYIRRDGTIVWVNLTVALVRDHAGEPDYFIAVIEDISDRKAVQDRLRLALMAANQGIYDLNLKTDRVTVEPEYALMLGYEPSIFSETVDSWRERVHPEDRTAVATAYQAYAQGETQQYQSEFRLRTQQGTWKWVLSIGKFVEWDAAGEPVRLLGTHTDIDERKRAEIALRNGEVRFRQTFEHMGVGMCVCDLNGVFVRVNQRFCEITGYTAPELVVMSFVDITHADDLEGDLAQVEQLLLGQRDSYTLEKRYIRKDQTVIWVNLTVSLLRTADGEAQQFLGAIEDITARKLAETELQTINRSLEIRVAERTQALANANAHLQTQTETLHQTNQLLALVVNSIPQRIFWKDRNSVLLGCNRRFAQDLGLTIESAIGKGNHDFSATPEEAAFYDDDDRLIMESGKASLHTIETQQRSDGSVVHLDTSKVPLRNGAGQVIGLLGCYEDITQRRQLEASVQQQLQKEQVLSALVQQMRQILNVQETFSLAVTQIRRLLGIDRVVIYALKPDRSGQVIAESVASMCPSLLGQSLPSTAISPEHLQTYARGEACSVSDTKQGDLSSCIDLFSKDIQVRARVLVPIIEHGSNQVWGLLIGQQCDRPHQWQPWELEFLQQLSQHLAIAVQQIHLYDQLQQELRQRQQAEQALRASEARLQSVTDSVNGCIAYLDIEQRYQFVNHTYEVWFGRSKADILGNTAESLIGPHAYKKAGAYFERALEGETVSFENELPHPQGGIRSVSVSVVPDIGQNQQVKGCYLLITDISDRKQVEEHLQALSTRLNLAVESAGLGIWDWDITQNHVVWDARMYALYGTTPDEFSNLYQAWLSRVHPEDQAYAEATSLSARKGEQPYDIEFRVVHPDQSVHYIKANAVVQRDAAGNPYRMTGINYDITDLKQAEAELREQGQRERLLREITQRIRQSLDLTTIFATACDEIRAVLRCDRVGIFKFDLASHYTTGEFWAESTADEFTSILSIPVHDHCFGEQYAEQYRQGRYLISANIFQNGISPCHAEILEQFGVRACMVMPLMQGEDLWGLLCVHQCRSTRVWQPTEIDLVHQLSVQMAIAIQQAHSQQQLTERNEQLARATHMKDEFLANMSHEIRTPMNAVIGMTKLALETSLTTQQRGYLSKIDKSASVLLHVIDDILDFSKIEAGKLHLEQVPFSLNEVLSNLADVTGLQAEQKGLELLFNVSAESPHHLIGDPLRLGQVLLNLVSNAIKFTATGHIVVSVTPVADSAAAATLRFTVADTGIGLAADQQSRLFQAFSQADASTTRRFGGTGLGLAISKRLVDLMQGEIGIESRLGEGSSFWFTATFAIAPHSPNLLPQPNPDLLGWGQPAPVGDEHSAIAQPIPPAVLNQVRVLLVEDHEINQELAVELLTQAGAIVTIANNGQEACDRVGTETFDVVLMDCQMPVVDGYEATQHIRTMAQGANIPIIAMTANAMQGDREKCLQAGMNDYLAKPIVKENLYSLIQRWAPAKQRPNPSISSPPTQATPEVLDATTFAPLALFDTTLGLYYVNDNPVLYRKLLLRFLTQQASFAQQVDQAMAAGDRSTVLHLAHSLKGLSGTLGCKMLQTKAAKLENILRKQEDADLDGILADVVTTLAEVLAELETWAAAQPPTLPPQPTATIDWLAVTTHCRTMANALETNLGEAMTNLTFLQEILSNVPDACDLVNTLTTAIDCFDIGAAKHTLQKLATLAETHL